MVRSTTLFGTFSILVVVILFWAEDQTFEHRSVIAEVNVGEKHYEIPAEAKTGIKSKQKRWESEVRNIFPRFLCNFQGCHVPVDGSEILRSPVEVG